MRQYPFATAALFVVTLFAAGCAELPQSALDAASTAQTSAVAAGAPEYSPESYRAAEEAQAALDAELKIQADKMAILRSYERASQLASTARVAAETAATDAVAGREAVRSEATTMIAEARAAVGMAETALTQAPGGKGTQQDLAALKADLQAAMTLVTDADASLIASQFRDAKTKAEASKTAAMAVTSAVEQAVAARKPRR